MASPKGATIKIRRVLPALAWAGLALACSAWFAADVVRFGWSDTWREGAFLLGLVWVTWLLWGAPLLVLEARGVHVRNAWWIHDVEWGALVRTKRRFGLGLVTTARECAVSAAPARSGIAVTLGPRSTTPDVSVSMEGTRRLSLSAHDAGIVLERYRESVGTEAGSAVRRRLNPVTIVLTFITTAWVLAAIV